MKQLLQYRKFKEIDLSDPFFDSLKADYAEFESWFHRKGEESAIVFEEDGKILGFLYPKQEDGAVEDVVPPLLPKKRYKVGTFKIEAHGTKLGERFLKKLFDIAILRAVEELYVTVFSKHQALISLFKTYGFREVGEKHTQNGVEKVLVKEMRSAVGDSLEKYPFFETERNEKWLLGIKPVYHSRLFPDSILVNESFDVVKDVSHTNSIHKVYVCYMSEAQNLKPGDAVVIYRMSDGAGPARFRSVATSVCLVEELHTRASYSTEAAYIDYCERYSVFGAEELSAWWKQYPNKPFFVIKLSYNGAFSSRITRGDLIDKVELNENDRWGLLSLTNEQFDKILSLGGVDHLVLR